MDHLKGILLVFSLVFGAVTIQAQQIGNTIAKEDIESLIGTWKGSLTYIDYNSNQPYSMPSNLIISSKKAGRKLLLNYQYPNEPKANSTSKFKISKDRTILNGKQIISRKMLTDGKVEIITEHSGKDGNDRQSALIRNIYIIGKEAFIIRKEVKFINTDKWLKRNEYNFEKNE